MSDSRTPDPALPTVEVVLFDGVDELDAVGPFEVLHAAGFGVRPVAIAAGIERVRGANGLTIAVDGPLGDAPGLLIVPGGGWLATTTSGVRPLVEDGALPEAIAARHAAGTVVASVCTGALLLGAAGILAGRPAVTNRLTLDDLRAFGADVRPEARVVDDGDVLTAGGPLAGVDLAIRLVERFRGERAAVAAAARIEHERRGPLLVTREDTVAGSTR